MYYLFVGERRSQKAISLNVTWDNGRLAAKQLWDALEFNGLDCRDQTYMNLWRDDGQVDHLTLIHLELMTPGNKSELPIRRVIVGMGGKVGKYLDSVRIPHLKMIHPAARGKIRRKERYAEHVAQVLGVSMGEFTLTKPQRDVLDVLLNEPVGKEMGTGEIGRAIGMHQSYIDNYLGARLTGLQKRGFLERRTAKGRKAAWSLGPMIDRMKEEGLIRQRPLKRDVKFEFAKELFS